MKRRVVLILILTFIVTLTGCQVEDAGMEDVIDDKASIIKKALIQGKLALANEEYSKAKSSFRLAIEEGDSTEAKDYLDIIEKVEQFISELENDEIEKANRTLESLKGHDFYEKVQFLLESYEITLTTIAYQGFVFRHGLASGESSSMKNPFPFNYIQVS